MPVLPTSTSQTAESTPPIEPSSVNSLSNVLECGRLHVLGISGPHASKPFSDRAGATRSPFVEIVAALRQQDRPLHINDSAGHARSVK